MVEYERICWDRASLIRANWPAYPNPTNYRYDADDLRECAASAGYIAHIKVNP
jgi:hypothetical protein